MSTAVRCTCCHQIIRQPKATKTVAPVDLSTLTTAELFAHYKKTAPIEDARFFLRTQTTLRDELKATLETLIAAGPSNRTEFYRQLRRVQSAHFAGMGWTSYQQTGVPAWGCGQAEPTETIEPTEAAA